MCGLVDYKAGIGEGDIVGRLVRKKTYDIWHHPTFDGRALSRPVRILLSVARWDIGQAYDAGFTLTP